MTTRRADDTDRPTSTRGLTVRPPNPETPPGDTGEPDDRSPWRAYESRSRDGLRVRVASSRRDAQGIRDVLHNAWQVGEDEGYFYRTFNDPDAIYRKLIAPSLATSDLRALAALCLIGERDGRVVATSTLVLDHDRRTVELGRGAIARDCQNQSIPRHSVAVIKKLRASLPDYALVADITALSRGATWFARAVGSEPVALHPSLFAIQPRCVDRWLDKLTRSFGETAAHALIGRSTASGLGRFAAAWHMSARTSAPFRPHLTPRQHPFFAYTCDAMHARPGAVDQPPRTAPERIADNPCTRTRTVTNPSARLDPRELLADAERAGVETVIVQVPCDREHELACRRLEAAGAILCGVFPEPSGHWVASYTALVGAAHRRQVIANLVTCAAHAALDPSYHRLLDLMLDALAASGHRAAQLATRRAVTAG